MIACEGPHRARNPRSPRPGPARLPRVVSYRVELPVFSGPLDLLLHLVRQQEVDIHRVRIAAILEGYLKHLEVLQQLDLSDIGDFLVMASTLMEIKSRELLPREAVELEEELDPRDDLIRRLLEYKRYRDLARELEGRGERRQHQTPLVISVPKELAEEDDAGELDLGEAGIWDLTEAFAKLLEEIGGQGEMKVEVEKRDVAFYTERLLTIFKRRPEQRFEEVFDRTEGRYGLIGTLMALLEMMKQGYLRALQEECFGPIHLAYRGGQEVTARQVMSGIEAEEAAQELAREIAAEAESAEVEGEGEAREAMADHDDDAADEHEAEGDAG